MRSYCPSSCFEKEGLIRLTGDGRNFASHFFGKMGPYFHRFWAESVYPEVTRTFPQVSTRFLLLFTSGFPGFQGKTYQKPIRKNHETNKTIISNFQCVYVYIYIYSYFYLQQFFRLPYPIPKRNLDRFFTITRNDEVGKLPAWVEINPTSTPELRKMCCQNHRFERKT